MSWEGVADVVDRLEKENNRLASEVKYLNARCNSYAEHGVSKDQEIERLRNYIATAYEIADKARSVEAEEALSLICGALRDALEGEST